MHPTNPEVNKEATFTITISGFSQKDHQVRWFLRGSEILEKKVCSDTKIHAPKLASELQIGEDGLYFCSSTLKYTPTEKDNGNFIHCVFTAEGLGIICKKMYQLSLTGKRFCSPLPRDHVMTIKESIVPPKSAMSLEPGTRCQLSSCDINAATTINPCISWIGFRNGARSSP